MSEDNTLISDESLQQADENDRKWRKLVDSANQRAQALGLSEDDIPRLVTEARRERHAR
jgi:hypothetical protein